MPPPGRGLGPHGFLTDEEKQNLPQVDAVLIRRILSYLTPYLPQFLLVFVKKTLIYFYYKPALRSIMQKV